MFNSPVLDLVILLSFTYFIGSIILSSVNEAIAATFRLRQADLEKGLYRFFFSPSWRLFVKNRFLASPNIQTLMKQKDRLPAYIPARNFVLAIIEQLNADSYKNRELQSINKQDGTPVLPDDMMIVLQTIGKQISAFPVEQFSIEFEKRLEEFYNLTMDRVTGWYKKRVRRLLLILGLTLSVLLNIDTIKIANDAMADKGKLSGTVDNIAANLKNFDSLKSKSLVINDTAGTIRFKESADNLEKVLVMYEKTTGYELGYKSFDDFKKQWQHDFWKKLIGILLTAFALQLGANYWFDLLNKAVNIRATGRKPDEQRPAPKP